MEILCEQGNIKMPALNIEPKIMDHLHTGFDDDDLMNFLNGFQPTLAADCYLARFGAKVVEIQVFPSPAGFNTC